MDFEESQTEKLIRSGVQDIIDKYGEKYWLDLRNNNEHPTEFKQDLADNGWLGVMIPEEHGGEGMGLRENVIIAEELGMSGGGRTATYLALGTSMFGELLKRHGTEEQKEEWLPRIVEGNAKWALGITEPDAGLNTTQIDTRAVKDGDEYVINGRKIWTTGISSADRVLIVARTIPKEEADRRSYGISIFYADPDDPNIDYDKIPKDVYHHHPSFNSYYDDLRVPEENLIGNENEGLYHLFDLLNNERIGIAAGAYGIGRYVLEKAADYANERVVFDDPIGAYQSIQHPLADAYANLETARLMVHKAAWMVDNGYDQKEVGPLANISNLKTVEAAWEACEAAKTTFGGMSISQEMGITKYWEEIRHQRTAPVTEEMILNYIAENELGLPRSY